MTDYLIHLYLPGAVALWASLAFALAALWGYSLVLRGDAAALGFARRAYACFSVAIVLVVLLFALVLAMRDFRIEYVFQYSGLDLPGHYQIASFWAGQKGSFLIWLFWGALLGLLVARSAGKAEPEVMGIYLLTLLGILFILVRENPFVLLDHSPTDGQGLNPLLQDDWMVIHPPIMFVGYASSAIPFAFAMAALWRRRYDDWAARAFPWALGGFLVLGAAILMGGYWAYKTLGWGGFWGWDPVENASLIPWLFGTVLIHGLHLERTRGRYRRVNFVLSALVYLSVLYGTFLTRSGVLADFSVHSFVDLGISGWLIALMVGFLGISIWLLATRLRHVPTEKNEDPFLSRGTFMVLATIAITVSAIVITFGTSAPLLTRFLEDPGQVGPDFYNAVNRPLAILMAALLAAVPFLTWKGIAPKQMAQKIWPGLLVAAAMTVGFALWQVRGVIDLLFVFLASLALATNTQTAIAKARVGGFASAGGYLAHVGVGVMLLGILASGAYDRSTKVSLVQGVPSKVEDMTMTFTRYLPPTPTERDRMEIEVRRDDGSEFKLYPKMFLNERTRQLMVNPDIRKSAIEHLYVSPIEFDPGTPRLELAKGESGKVGDLDIRFVGFDLTSEGNAIAQMASGKPIAIGAVLEVKKATDGAANEPQKLLPLYRLDPSDGRVETPSVALPGGGSVTIAGIDATQGKVRLDLSGISNPSKLAIDVTIKPLIELVWLGLYLMLAGGALAAVRRLREVRLRERLAAAAEAAPSV